MKFYLSSYRIPVLNDLVELVGKDPKETKVAFIPNAKDYYAQRARAYKVNEAIEDMRVLGFQPDVVDLGDYNSVNDLRDVLQSYDLIWATGGNTFCLREATRKSGFDEIIREILEAGIVWAGDSAGAVIVGPTLRGVEFADVPEYAEAQVYEGLNLIKQIVIPHADNVAYGDAITRMIEMYSDDPDMVAINDNQAFIIDGDTTKVVTGVQ